MTLSQYSYPVLFSGDDHFCCFQPTLGGYDCNSDPSYACETYQPCEILLQIDSADADGFGSDFGEGVGSSRPTAQEMALIEESVHQFCSSGTAGVGMEKCREICQGKLRGALANFRAMHEQIGSNTWRFSPFRNRSSLLL